MNEATQSDGVDRWEFAGRLYVVFKNGERHRSEYRGLRELHEGEDVVESTDTRTRSTT